MKILFLVNDVREVVARMSTTLLITVASRRHEVWVCGVKDLHAQPGTVAASARHVKDPKAHGDEPGEAKVAAGLRRQAPTRLDLGSCDVVFIRTNPGRDIDGRNSHRMALHMLGTVADRGVTVVNAPSGLLRASTKTFLLDLPSDVIPDTLVSCSPAEIERWVTKLPGSAILKPVAGTRGEGVFVVHPQDRTNLRQLIDTIGRDGYIMAQAFVPEASAGDVRVLVVDGKVLTLDGRAAAIARIPKKGDFRSNVHVGGRPAPATVSPAMREAIKAVRPILRRKGLFLVGLDFIGGKIIELNVFSPGGFGNASQHQERNFPDALLDALEEKVIRDRERARTAQT